MDSDVDTISAMADRVRLWMGPEVTVCVVTAGGPYPWIMVNALGKAFGPIDVILEEPEPHGQFLMRRARRTGWVSAAGQLVTMLLIRAGKIAFARRIDRIVAEHELEQKLGEKHRVTRTVSVNSEHFLEEIERLNPEVVLLVGCRVLRAEILQRMACPVLNYHAGITPKYRGMNGGYWALASGDRGNFGATVHLVDAGIDTGQIIAQTRGTPDPGDNIMTYAHRLAALSRDMCIGAVRAALEGQLVMVPPEGESRQWYHPPIWTYFWIGITRGVW